MISVELALQPVEIHKIDRVTSLAVVKGDSASSEDGTSMGVNAMPSEMPNDSNTRLMDFLRLAFVKMGRMALN
ncbi:hypothetical protein [Roseofilum capinflatum]|uniref:Uncharacterized protein n=1 Tax=Roseofilum capinflatum BLCC-M114 TaxID=3022440 RepID=A0ABT7B8S2_9CYAN|nr:hypothetical protein [Roseofilum capinflatum]MDJ1175569.1 hypothetical protein [Roseofilum capinflatum BLCC-M114]